MSKLMESMAAEEDFEPNQDSSFSEDEHLPRGGAAERPLTPGKCPRCPVGSGPERGGGGGGGWRSPWGSSGQGLSYPREWACAGALRLGGGMVSVVNPERPAWLWFSKLGGGGGRGRRPHLWAVVTVCPNENKKLSAAGSR